MKWLNSIKWKHYISYVFLVLFTLIFGALALTDNLRPSMIELLINIGVNITLAVSLSMVVGFLGELSLGHAGFMCIGAFFGGKVALLLDIGTWPTLIIAFLVGGIFAVIFGVVIGLPALRLRGDYLAIVTLAFGEIVAVVIRNQEFFGGQSGMRVSSLRLDKPILMIVAFVVVILCYAVMQNLIRSKHGRAITAIRDNEIAARATGINVTKYKLVVFTVAAFFAGIAGVIICYQKQNITTAEFTFNRSIQILVMVVLGGMGSLNGAIVSAAAITFLDKVLQDMLGDELAIIKNIIYATVLIILVIYNNAPALKGFREKYNLKNLFKRFRKHDPSNVHDDEAKWDRVPTKIQMDEVLSTDIQVSSPYTPDKPDKGAK